MTWAPFELKNNPIVSRKRKLIVRDWFFYVVWFVRLRKLFRGLITNEELLNNALHNDERYKEIATLFNFTCNFHSIIKFFI